MERRTRSLGASQGCPVPCDCTVNRTELAAYLRRRIRMCHWTQWRRIRTRVRRLLALGVPYRWAIRTGVSSKGPWHMSRTYAINVALSDAYLARQGLLSIRELWIQFAHLRRTA